MQAKQLSRLLEYLIHCSIDLIINPCSSLSFVVNVIQMVEWACSEHDFDVMVVSVVAEVSVVFQGSKDTKG